MRPDFALYSLRRRGSLLLPLPRARRPGSSSEIRMNSQGDPYLPQFRTGQAASCGILLMAAALVAVSCARMPTALRSKVTVTGLVLVASGKPLPGTTLFFMPGEPMLEQTAHAIADSSGTYSVRLISGKYDVDLKPPSGLGFLARTEQVTVSDSHARLDFTFSGYRVTGRVVAPNGSLVDSGRVMAILGPSGHSNGMSLIKHGDYSLLLPGGRYSLQATAANYWSGLYPERQESLSIDADTTIDFRLGGISVSGRVLGPDGLPMRDVGVEARSPMIAGIEVNRTYPVQGRTSADGRYQLYLPTSSYSIWFRPPHPFFIVPRVVGPVTITEPTSIDVDLAGIEWAGTVKRVDTHEPAPGISVTVKLAGDEKRAASTRSGPRGDFRFILEADQCYDLETYDPTTRERVVMLQGLTASADTLLAIHIPPTINATRADSTIKLSIRSVAGNAVHRKRRWPPEWIEVTLQNTGRDTVTLVLPGDGSYLGWRTPLMDWEVRAPGGPPLKRMPVAVCGNINPLRAEEIFRLPPGAQRTFRAAVPMNYRYEKSHRYQFRLSYENRPRLVWGGMPLGSHDPEAMLLLQHSTQCKLVSNTLELKVK